MVNVRRPAPVGDRSSGMSKCVVRTVRDETIAPMTKPFSTCNADTPKRSTHMSGLRRLCDLPQARLVGEIHMRGFSFVLTLAFVLAAPPLAGSSEQGALGVGTFVYGGSPPVASSSPLTVATR